MDAPAVEMEVIERDDVLCLRRYPGRQKRLVVVFGGAKLPRDGSLRNEFLHTVSHNGKNPVLNVQDMKCTWYSGAGLVDRITAGIKAEAERVEAEEIVTLGNSMGGFGAILFARELPVARALALSPQISMHPEVIDETRFDEYLADFGPQQAARSVAEIIPEVPTEVTVVFGTGSKYDNAQAALLAPSPNLRLSHVARSGHNTAEWLKKHDLLAPLVRSVIYGYPRKLDTVLGQIEERLGGPGWHQVPGETPADEGAHHDAV